MRREENDQRGAPVSEPLEHYKVYMELKEKEDRNKREKENVWLESYFNIAITILMMIISSLLLSFTLWL